MFQVYVFMETEGGRPYTAQVFQTREQAEQIEYAYLFGMWDWKGRNWLKVENPTLEQMREWWENYREHSDYDYKIISTEIIPAQA